MDEIASTTGRSDIGRQTAILGGVMKCTKLTGWIRFLLLILIGITVHTSASGQSRVLDCSLIGLQEITDRHTRVTSPGITVLPPSQGNWCIGRPAPGVIGFNTARLYGEMVSPQTDYKLANHTFAITIITYELKGWEISNQMELEDLATKWIRAGFVSRVVAGVPRFILSPSDTRKTVEMQVQSERLANANCVKFRADVENSGYGRLPSGSVIFDSNDGYLCRHPSSNNFLVQVHFAEQRVKGYSDSNFANKIRQEAESTFQSVQFTPL